jgi:hypothetical protein
MHPGADLTTTLRVQKFPFGADHPARPIVNEVLKDPNREDHAWCADGVTHGAESVLLTSVLAAAVQPAVVSSLYGPIAGKWNKVVAFGGDRHTAIGGFWTYNRARLLTESIPLTQPAIEAITRGWYAGRLLGLVSAPRDNTAMTVHWKDDKGKSTAHALPWPLLRDGLKGQPELESVREDWLPALLEHLGLAMMLWAGQPAILDGYEDLHRIGMLEGTSRSALNEWIRTGVQPVESGLPTQITGVTAEERRAAVQRAVDTLVDRLKTREKEAVNRTTADYGEFIRIPYGSELLGMMITQLERLAANVVLPDDDDLG